MKIKEKLAQVELVKVFIILAVCLMTLTFVWAGIDNMTSNSINKMKNETYIDDLRTTDTIREPNNGLLLAKKYKSHYSSEKKIIIEDSKYNVELEMNLLSDYNIKVSSGNDTKIASLKFIDWKDGRTDIFDSVILYNKLNDYEKESKEVWFKYKSVTTEQYCYTPKSNETKEILKEVCENHDITNWILFDSLDDLPHKNIEVGIFTETIEKENYEWVIDTEGFKCLEWASYLVDSLVSYYKLDEVSGDAVDSDGTSTLTEVGTVGNDASGIINSARSSSSSSNYFENTTHELSVGTDVPFTINGWVKITTDGNDKGIWALQSGDTTNDFHNKFYIDTDNKLHTYSGYRGHTIINFAYSTALPSNTWTMVTFRYQADRKVSLGVNGVLEESSIAHDSGSDSDSNILQLGKDWGSVPIDGSFDEFGFWNIALNQSAITDLCGDGSPPSYPFNATTPFCQFNGTVKDGDGNAINGAKIVIASALTDVAYGNTTSNATGMWEYKVTDDGNYTVYAYQPNNNTRPGAVYPYVECIGT